MKLHLDWLKEAKYSDNYITDGVLFVRKSFVYVPEDFGYRKMNSLWEEELDKAFLLQPIHKLEKFSSATRTYAKTKITRYKANTSYVILNDEYSYLWNSWNCVVCTLQPSNDVQYKGILGIYEDCVLKALITPITVEDKYLFDDNFWSDIDKKIGLGKFLLKQRG